MSGFLKALLCVVLVKTLVNSTVLTKSGTDDARKPPCNVNNYFYAGPNTKKIEQQLAEIREEIKALKQNRTSGSSSSGKGLQYFLKHPSFRAVFPASRRSSVPCVSDWFKREYHLQTVIVFRSRFNSCPLFFTTYMTSNWTGLRTKHGPGVHGPSLWTGSMDPLSWTGSMDSFFNNEKWTKTEIVQK